MNDSVIKAQNSVLISGYSDPIFGEDSSLVFTYTPAAGDAGNLVVESPTLQLEIEGSYLPLQGVPVMRATLSCEHLP
ncbi:MAG: hypothetical protein HC800_10460 [Phormidesmis sp. RL_2_1]|nr:hypothetical protein [Phormidesmis sp. RL_2_1]